METRGKDLNSFGEGEGRSGRTGFALSLARGEKVGLAWDIGVGEAPEKPSSRVLPEETGRRGEGRRCPRD